MLFGESFALDTAIETTIKRIILELEVSEGGGRGSGETSQGRFFKQNRYMSLPLTVIQKNWSDKSKVA